MPNHLSVLGIIHTIISILALFAGFTCLYRTGKINPLAYFGRLYVFFTILTCLTALPIMKTGHFTGAHGLAIFVLILLPIGKYVKNIRSLIKYADYIQILVMSATLFLSCIPAIVETLTRLPIAHPIARGPNDHIIQTGLRILTIIFLGGVSYQLIKLRSTHKQGFSSDDVIHS
jgi:hypothetical protein